MESMSMSWCSRITSARSLEVEAVFNSLAAAALLQQLGLLQNISGINRYGCHYHTWQTAGVALKGGL